MRKIITSLLFTVLFQNLQAQNNLVKQWDKRYGGTGDDSPFCILQLSDSNLLLGGYSASSMGADVSQPKLGLADYWLIKTNSTGSKIWDKRFGGSGSSVLMSAYQAADGNYLLGGYTNASNFDVSGPVWGENDFWVVKTDTAGIKLWDHNYGGSLADGLMSLSPTNDGGFIAGGFSRSDSSGTKTQNNWDPAKVNYDYWIIKCDSLGNQQWDKRFGGYANDYLFSVKQTNDGGYILGGSSSSRISGDKTEDAWDTLFARNDFWIVKTDAQGNKQWDHRYGGPNFEEFSVLQLTNDGGYLLAGTSGSGISGNKSSAMPGYWLIKIDSMGNKLLDKGFGAPSSFPDALGSLTLTKDGGYLLTGTTYAPAGYDKTENNLGVEQGWLVKLNSSGLKQWDKTIFTTGHDEASYAIQSYDSCYIILTMCNAGIGGYKTETSWGNFDFWFVKFKDTMTVVSSINDHQASFKLSVYPNPFTSSISMAIHKKDIKNASFIIRNTNSQVVFNQDENNIDDFYTKTVDLSFLSKGIYLIELTVDGEKEVRKIIKE